MKQRISGFSSSSITLRAVFTSTMIAGLILMTVEAGAQTRPPPGGHPLKEVHKMLSDISNVVKANSEKIDQLMGLKQKGGGGSAGAAGAQRAQRAFDDVLKKLRRIEGLLQRSVAGVRFAASEIGLEGQSCEWSYPYPSVGDRARKCGHLYRSACENAGMSTAHAALLGPEKRVGDRTIHHDVRGLICTMRIYAGN